MMKKTELKVIPKNVDEYIAMQPDYVQVKLKQLRALIKKNAADAEELISYQMPAYKLNGMLVYFAGYKNHIGFYPTASGIAAFKDELLGYKSAKGSVQFPVNEKLPVTLIAKMVKHRVKENMFKQKNKHG